MSGRRSGDNYSLNFRILQKRIGVIIYTRNVFLSGQRHCGIPLLICHRSQMGLLYMTKPLCVIAGNGTGTDYADVDFFQSYPLPLDLRRFSVLSISFKRKVGQENYCDDIEKIRDLW